MEHIDKSTVVNVIEKILQNRRGADLRAHEVEIELLANVITGVADAKTKERVNRHLESCAECRETLVTLHWSDSTERGSLPSASSDPMRNKHSTSQIAKWAAISAAAVLIITFAWLLLYRNNKTLPSDNTMMEIKGQDDNLAVVVGRGASRYILQPLDRLETGDQLGIFYSTNRPGYLMVMALDASGAISLLSPAERSESCPIETGENISLPDGAKVEAGSGCEWVIGVFSDTALTVKEVTRAIQHRIQTDRRCGIDIKMKAARSIRVLSFVR